MPELPEVETIKRELEKSILRKKIIDVVINNPKVIKQPSTFLFKKQLKNKTINKIFRKGKALIWELSSKKFLVIHLRMTGQLVYPGDGSRSRVSFKLANRGFLDYNDRRLLGELRLVEQWQELLFFKTLGPEPFDLTEKQFSVMLASKKTKIKPLLMDQSFMAGVGNLYACEVLFKSKIDPFRSSSDLTVIEKRKLFLAIKTILKKAIQYKGSSIDQYITVSGEKGTYASQHKVYDRAGESCFVCKQPVQRITQGGRGTYFCRRCQL